MTLVSAKWKKWAYNQAMLLLVRLIAIVLFGSQLLSAALLPPQMLDGVVAIGSKDAQGNKSWRGTGFLYGDLEKPAADGKGTYSIYIVTNKHVLKDIDTAIIRFNPTASSPTQEYPVELKNPNGSLKWTGHSDSNVDIGILPFDIPPEIRAHIPGFSPFFRNNQTTATRQSMNTMGVAEGDGLFVLGFPIALFQSNLNALFPAGQNVVFVRHGIISRIRDCLAKLSNNYLIDAFVFPGNSGGPVILEPQSTAITGTKVINSSFLIGVIDAYLPYQDVAISPQTQRAKLIEEENSGLAVVIPMDFVDETIDQLKQKRQPVH